ncbi:1-phosphofructokinase [Bacillus sp. M6-12]|uniref:1-phosphofructokinase n=1 Tax=Bacillus sp. M6-12 TaxID=2054166 RepID=UPI000C77F76E|nr:1-phosphofructokinase [Bacillus sp. M6-12]PLS18756.1 1-phosphofructokinase [Bacillus sp. M6-12]
MITTVTLNPSVDRRYFVNDFATGKVTRVSEFEATAGGKGLNVTRVVHLLGSPILATGLLGGKSGEFIEESLTLSGIDHQFLRINGETRTCIAILSQTEQTEILEPGPSAADEDVQRFLSLYDTVLDRSSIIVGSGSLMKGMPLTLYRNLIERAREKGIPFLLDTSGQSLVEAISAGPSFIKPNLEELEAISGMPLKSDEDIVSSVDKVTQSQVETVMVSLGGDGALVIHKGEAFRIRIPKVSVKNPVGSGDSTVAGFAVGTLKGYSIQDRMRFAIACGTANAMEDATGFVNKKTVVDLMGKIIVGSM